MACVAAVIALAAACGGEKGRGTGAKTPTDGPHANDDPRTEAERQADEDAAEAMLPTLDDFPPSWQEDVTEDEADEQDEELEAELAECLGIDPAEFEADDPNAT